MESLYVLFEDVIEGKKEDSHLVSKAKELKAISPKGEEFAGRLAPPGSLNEFKSLFLYYKDDLSSDLISEIQCALSEAK